MLKLKNSNFIELFLSFAGSLDESEYVEWNMLILEIFYYMYIGRDPEEILSNKVISNGHRVTELLQKEQRINSIEVKKRYSRHSRFGGSYFIELDVIIYLYNRKYLFFFFFFFFIYFVFFFFFFNF